MKNKKIAFSGAMAAIMLSAGANAATTQIASKQYVDDKETAIMTTVGNTYATQSTVEGITTNITNITKQITDLDDTLNNAETGISAKADQAATDAAAAKTAAENAQKDVDALETVVGDETSGLVKGVADAAAAAKTADDKAVAAGNAAAAAQGDVDTLAAKVNSTTDGLATKASQTDLTALTSRVSTAEGEIDTLQGTVGTGTLTTTAQTIVAAVNELKTKTDGMATEGNFEEMNNKITTMETTVAGKADKATTLAGYGITDAYTKTETVEQIEDYAIPKPSTNCTAASGTCVLSVNTSGALEWVEVTNPVK